MIVREFSKYEFTTDKLHIFLISRDGYQSGQVNKGQVQASIPNNFQAKYISGKRWRVS